MRCVLPLLLVAAGCAHDEPGRGDADGEGRDGGRDGASDGPHLDGEGEGGEAGPPVAGPLTFVGDSFAVVADRVCDVDGDGDLDSAIADVGPAYAELLAGVINSIGQSERVEGRILLHLPWVDDLRGPDDEEMTLIVAEAVPTDEGGVAARLSSLDECMEPLYVGEASLASGELSGRTSGFPLKLASDRYVALEETRYIGSVEPSGSSLDLYGCVVAPIRSLGDLPLGDGNLSMLEVIVAGGSPVGLAGVPGVTPDVDLDGDGLERLLVDEEAELVSCLDGDGTLIEGRDCWLDERMADGFSLAARVGGVPARFDGVAVGGQRALATGCEPGAPADSSWRSCGGGTCERWSSRACEPGCGGEGRQHCDWDCAGYEACLPIGSEDHSPESCADLLTMGGASCEGSPPTVRLVDGQTQTRGVALAERLSLGSAAIVVEARARLAPGASAVPCCGWGITAYLDEWGEPMSDNTFRLGPNLARSGYAAQWLTTNYFLDDVDELRLRWLEEESEWERSTLDVRRAPRLPAGLDAGAGGSVDQTLRLVLVPDLEETATNEQAVLVQALDADGTVAVTLACSGADCPIALEEGGPVTIAVSSGTIEADSVVELLDLRVEVGGLCP